MHEIRTFGVVNKWTRYSEIEPSDIFICDGEPYLQTNDNCAVEMLSGWLVEFEADEIVRKVTSDILIVTEPSAETYTRGEQKEGERTNEL